MSSAEGVIKTIQEFFTFIVGIIKEFFDMFKSIIPTTTQAGTDK